MALLWPAFAKFHLPAYRYLLHCSRMVTVILAPYHPRQQMCGFYIHDTRSLYLDRPTDPQKKKNSVEHSQEDRTADDLLLDLQHQIAQQTRCVVDSHRLEQVIKPLLDMGFDQNQVKLLFELNPRLESSLPQSLEVPRSLLFLGLNANSVVKILVKCPKLFKVKEKELQPRVDNLRRLGLVEGSLQRLVAYYPQILCLPLKRVNNTARFLKDRCLFTGQEVTEIMRTAPNVLFEDHGEIEYKFQHVYFRMGIKQSEIVKSMLFRIPLFDIRARHIFLERLGRYQTPSKDGYTQIVNPKLSDVLTTSEEQYLNKVAHSSKEEFEVFKKMLALEDDAKQDLEGISEDEDSDDEFSEHEDENDSEPVNKL